MREAEILDLIRSQDDSGMEELLKHYGPLMRYIIKPILRDKHDIEDCLSETAMRIWKNVDTYDENKGSFAAWVTAITRNTALNMIRRQNRHPETEIEDETALPAMPKTASPQGNDFLAPRPGSV